MQGRSPCPRSAERGTLLCLLKRRRGSKGEPSPGVPPFIFRLCVCADTLGGGRCPVLPFDPISLVLAQRNGVEPPKKGAFLPWWLHHSRERCCLGGRDVPRPTWGGAGAGRGLGALRVPFAGGERDRLWPLCAVGRLSGRHCTFTLPPTTKARFFGAPPRFFAQEQRNGVERAGPARSIAQ